MAYCLRIDIENRFGKVNVKRWADLDNNDVESEIETRITAAITYAQSLIDDTLRNGPYAIPFSEPVIETIKQIAADLAGVWLYESRGVEDFDPETNKPQHKLHFQRANARKTLKMLLTGAMRLNLTVTSLTPVVVADTPPDRT